MNHPRFDFENYARRYPLPESAGCDYLSTMRGLPASVIAAEQLRTRDLLDVNSGEGQVTEVVLWGPGDPAHAALTKIGGVPYRPARKPWPRDEQGRNLTFIGQINFCDAAPVEDLPGDLLLLFALHDKDQKDLVIDEAEQNSLLLEWYRSNDITDPTRDVPDDTYSFERLYGVLHSSHDFPMRHSGTYEDLMRPLPDIPDEEWDLPAVWFQKTKIGGWPGWEQGCHCGELEQFCPEMSGRPVNRRQPADPEARNWTRWFEFVLQITSPLPDDECSDPLVGREEPFPARYSWESRHRYPDFAGAGTLYLFRRNGQFVWVTQR